MNNFTFFKKTNSTLLRIYFAAIIALSGWLGGTVQAQCDTEVSGVFTYCNSFHMGNPVTGYFVAFRVKDLTGDTLNVIDVNNVVPMNQGKRVNDINTQNEPANYTVAPLEISGVAADTLEYWYFGPYPNGSTFDIALVDPNNVCDTIFIASGTFDCTDNTGTSDPGACDADVPLYFLDFSQTEFEFGGGGGGNEMFDDIFLIMPRTRENFCCDLQPANQNCFEFIIRLDDQDIGLSLDDIGSGSTGGEIYADTLNMFACTGNSATTWPFTQSGGQSSDLPLCVGFEGQEFIVLSCKSGGNVTGAAIDAISNIFSPPEATIEPCNVSLEVFNVDSVVWSSDDDPTLANLINCTPDSTVCMFFYDVNLFGDVTNCAGDTFTYYVGGMPVGNECFGGDTLLFDTTYVVVYPVFIVDIESECTGDSLILTANIETLAMGCEYNFEWSNGDTTQTITVPFSQTEYFVTVTRADLPAIADMCVVAMDSIVAEGTLIVDCSLLRDTTYFCVTAPPGPDTSLVGLEGCATNAFIYTQDSSNGATGCQLDTLIITRYYIIDFDGDTTATTTDRDTCVQLLRFVDDVSPAITCPGDVTIECTESTAPADTGTATATDACDGAPQISSSDVTIAGACPQAYTIQRTWVATDACGNSSTCEQLISLEDSTAPVITCPDDVTIDCEESTSPDNTGTATASDNCDTAPVVTFADITTAGSCASAFTTLRTWTATDACGNTATCFQTIERTDSTAPVIDCPANVTVSCEDSTDPADTGDATASDNCDPAVVITSFDYESAPPVAPEFRWVYLPNGAGSGSCSSGSDCSSNTLCFGLIYTPGVTGTLESYTTGFFIDCVNGNDPIVSNSSCVMIDNSLEVEDCGVSGTVYFNSSGNTGGVPVTQNVSIQLHQICITLGAGQSVLIDEDETTDLSTSVVLTNNGLVSEFPSFTNYEISFDAICGDTCIYPQTIYRQFVATDGCGNQSTCLQEITRVDETAPAITCPIDLTIACNADTSIAATGIATATDNCDTDPVISYADVTVAGLCPQEYTVQRTWTATDICGNSSTCLQTIVLDDSTGPVLTCPGNITIECTESSMTSNTEDATATDDCDLTPVIFFDDVIIPGACPQEFTINRTFGAMDDCGNSSTCLQVITVDDSQAPSIVCPGDVTIECSDSTLPASTGNPTGTDNCDGTPNFSFTDTTIAGPCTQAYTINRTWVAADDCGNSTSCVQVIELEDTTPPVITCPGNTTIQCTASTLPANTGTATATDNCDPVLTITSTDVTVGGACPQEYTITRTWTAADDCGNTATCNQIIVIDDSTPPVITCPANTTIECTASTLPANTGTATATDNCDAAPAVTSTDVTVGGICPQELTINRTWRATDDCGNSSTCLQVITVDDSLPPVVTCPGDVTIDCSESTMTSNTGDATATDNCDLTPVLFFDDVIIPGACASTFVIQRTFGAMDDCGNSGTCVQFIFVQDTTAPTIVCPDDVTVDCANQVPPAIPGSIPTSDDCGTVTVTHVDVVTNQTCANRFTITRTYQAADDCGNTSTCTQVIEVDDQEPPVVGCPADQTVSCTAEIPAVNLSSIFVNENCGGMILVTHLGDVVSDSTCAHSYTVTRTYRASDVCGNSATCEQTIVVSDQTAPVVTCPDDVTVDCTSSTSADVTGTATATDNCNGVPVITSSDVTIAGACPQEYTINRTWLATDECGNTGSCVQSIFVDDASAPIITCPLDVTIDCAESTSPDNTGEASATDNCDGEPVITSSDVTVAGACAQEYIINRTWIATDACGNSSTCLQLIQLDDNTAPFITCPANTTIQCNTSTLPAATGTATASDNCDLAPTVTSSDAVVAGSCSQEMTINRTWTASDACGNTSTCLQIIVVDDSTVPTITCPVNITIQCNTSTLPAATGTATATDNCDDTPTIASSDVTIAGACPQEFTINRTWSATDDCGNTSTCLQIITVDDSTPPSITCPTNVTVNCASEVPAVNIASVTSSDNCGTTTITHVGDVMTNQTCANRFILTRIYRATDACGNSATCNQVINVFDQTPPSITCPGNVTINVQDSTLPANTGNPTSTDNCGGTPTITFADVTTAGECSNEFIISRTFTATDACGNTATCIQVVNVEGGCVVDLSLTKDLDPNQGPVSPGDNVNFVITVSNDGEQDISSVTIIDYIPTGFTLNDPDWTPGNQGSTGQSATITLSIGNGGLDANGLNPGETVTVGITLQADPNIAGGIYYNTAEILQVINSMGQDVTNEDVDSTPDQDDTNDPAGEDDHDIAAICILPAPEIIGDDYVCPEELVQYSVANPNPNNTYTWILSGGGTIIQNNGDNILVQWQLAPGGPFQLTVIESAGGVCEASDILLIYIQGVEPIACNDLIQISLGPDGTAFVDPSMILEGENEANNNYYVVITDQDGNVIPDATLTCEHAGQTFMVSVHNICNNQSCWGTITVEDKIAPQIECECPVGNAEPECEVNCLQVELLEDGIIPADLYPNVTDNCGDVVVTILDIDVEDEGCGGGFIIVTWKATDIGGNMATCTQQFNIIPLTLDSLTFPANYEGECNTSVHPSVTGWPQVDGLDITDNGGICNIFAGYWDKELNDCGGGRKIQRTWTVLDWCTQEIEESVQIIKLSDNEGPVLECPDDVTVGTDFWYCYANFSVPKPDAYDECSEIEKYELIASAGNVVYFGQHAVINNLPIGTHHITWIVTDECDNSSTCSFDVTVEDDVAPVANCDQHTIVSLTNDGPNGITLVPASVFDDGSYDNCGPVTFRVRRMDSCIDFDWTTEGACIDDIPGGVPPVNSRDRGTVHRPCVPFSCCDVGAGPIMVELEVTDAAGNVNYCMVEATVQDKISPFIACPPDIIISCDFWFAVEEGTFTDAEGNNDGSLDEDPLTPIFGNMFDAGRYDESVREPIVIYDPTNTDYFQPHTWGIDGWADDNCSVDLQVRVRVIDDCSGDDLPGNAPPHAVKLIERRFSAAGTNDGSAPATCTQRIWVVDYNPFYISDQTCNNDNPNDGVIWPCDVVLSDCPDDVSGTGVPVIFDDACSLIGVTYEDTRFDFVDGACFKILRDWAVIDWCQYNSQTGEGLWHYTQVIKVHDEEGPEFQDCPDIETLCIGDPGVSLPDNNQVFLGESNPESTSCSVHLDITKTVYEPCSPTVKFDVKVYLFNGPDFIQVQGITTAATDSNGYALMRLNTRQSPIQSIRLNGLPYNSPSCNDYHRILWSVEDGCGNWSSCEYLLRLDDCKQPTPVCINGLSTVVMPIGGQVTIWAKDFNASSVDDCTSADELLYSFSGDAYQPSFTYTCDNVPAFGVELTTTIYVADGGVDHNCNGQIEWSERNKDYCTTTIVIMDNNGVCDQSGSILAGEILTQQQKAVEKVKVTLHNPGHIFPAVITAGDGLYRFVHVPTGEDYTIIPERTDNAKNGVSTLDLVGIQKHLLGIQLFTSPYQFIAADASNNKSVSAIDLIEIRKLILGIYTEYPANTSWRFVDKGFPMSPTNPWPFNEQIFINDLAADSLMHNDFVAVKVGDVNNSAKANATQVVPRNGNEMLHVETVNQIVEADDIIEVDMQIPAGLIGWQWTLATAGLELVSVTSDDIQIGDEHVAMLEKGIVTMSWNSLEETGADEVPVTISMTWRATSPGKLSEMLTMTGAVTEAEGYTASGEIHALQLRFGQQGPAAFALYQNQPNPWVGSTVIGFDLPVSGDALLTIYDVTGKEVFRQSASYKQGYNQIEITDKQLPVTGVLYYRLESGGFTASKKMILTR
jgi:uncharacterized repeat protein (TIGR01451 family)